MAEYTKTISPDSAYYLKLSVSESNINIANNTSDINVIGTIYATKSNYGSYGTSSNTVFINGQQYNPSVYYDVYNGAVPRSAQIFNYTQTIGHNNDGSKTVSISWGFTGGRPSSQWNPNGTISTDVALSTIARASQPSVNTYPNNTPNFTVGNNVIIHMNRKSSSFTHTVVVTFGDWSKTLSTSATDNVSWDTSQDKAAIYATNTTGTSKSGIVTVTTKNGSTIIGTKTCDIKALFNQDELRPTFTNFGYSDTNSTITAITGDNQILVSGKSTLTATISTSQKATAKYSATMQSYTMTINGISQSEPYSTSAITKNLGSVILSTQENVNTVKSLVITAIDSRSKGSSVTKDITVIPYAKPIINAKATRENGFENNTTISIAGKFSPILVNNIAKNNVNSSTGVKYRYKKSSETTWGSWTNKTATIDRTNGTIVVEDFILSLDNQEAWNFEFSITDLLEESIAPITVSVGQPAFFIGEDGRVGIGGMPNKPKLTGEQGLVQVFGRLFADNIYPIGSIYMSATLDTVAKVQNALGGTWVKWGVGRVPVGVDTTQTEFNTVNKTGGEKTHFLTTNEMPSHRHNVRVAKTFGIGSGTWNAVPASDRGINEGTMTNTSDIATTGGDQAHNNLQPYITCYMYKRIATATTPLTALSFSPSSAKSHTPYNVANNLVKTPSNSDEVIIWSLEDGPQYGGVVEDWAISEEGILTTTTGPEPPYPIIVVATGADTGIQARFEFNGTWPS